MSSPACRCIGPLNNRRSANRPGDLKSSRAALKGSNRFAGHGKSNIRWNNASKTGRSARSLPTNLTT